MCTLHRHSLGLVNASLLSLAAWELSSPLDFVSAFWQRPWVSHAVDGVFLERPEVLGATEMA